MKASGRQRLEAFKEKVEALNNDAAYGEWISPDIFSEVEDSVNRGRLRNVQLLHLQTVWLTIIEHLRDILEYSRVSVIDEDTSVDEKNPLFPFLHSIVRVIQIPRIFSIFLSSINKDVFIAYQTLHPYLRLRVRQFIIAEIDNLLVKPISPIDYLERSENPGLYDVLENIIVKVNIKREQRLISHNLHTKVTQQMSMGSTSTDMLDLAYDNLSELMDLEEPFTPHSLGSLMSINVHVGAEITRQARRRSVELPVQYYARAIREDDDDDGSQRRHYSLITKIDPPRISDQLQDQMDRSKPVSDYPESEWINLTLSLPKDVIEVLEAYELDLGKKIQGHPKHSKYQAWIQKKAFAHELRNHHSSKTLTPKAFFATINDKPLLFEGWFGGRATLYYELIRGILMFAFFREACRKNGHDYSFGYRILNEELVKKLQTKLKRLDPLPDDFQYDAVHSLSEEDEYRWNVDKFGLLKYLLGKHEAKNVKPADLPYVKNTFLCYAKRSLPWLMSSDTQECVDEFQDELMNTLWVDNGGDGPVPQLELRKRLYIG